MIEITTQVVDRLNQIEDRVISQDVNYKLSVRQKEKISLNYVLEESCSNGVGVFFSDHFEAN